MHQTPVEPSGSQFADPFQFLDRETVTVRRYELFYHHKFLLRSS